jgi:hypothetical protein
MAKVYKGPYWNGKHDHDLNLFEMIREKARNMWRSKQIFKAGISEEDFVGEAFLLFESRKVHLSYDPSKGDFFRFFGVSLRNLMVDKVSTTYSHVKTSRPRETDADHVKNDKLGGTEMAVQRLDDESLHERLETNNYSPEVVIGLEEYEEVVREYAPTLSSVWFGDVTHPFEMVHPTRGHPLKSRDERMDIVRDEADRMLAVVAEHLFGSEISLEHHEKLVGMIVEQFSKWRGARGSYKKTQKQEEIEEPNSS